MVKVDISEKTKELVSTVGCHDCGSKTSTLDCFCSQCGKPISTYDRAEEYDIDLDLILEDNGLDDLYYVQRSDGEEDESAYILCNQENEYNLSFASDDCESSEYPIPRVETDTEVSDLINALDDAGLKYEKLHGIYTYWA